MAKPAPPIRTRGPDVASALQTYANLPEYAQIDPGEIDEIRRMGFTERQYQRLIGRQRQIQIISELGVPVLYWIEESAGSKAADIAEKVKWGAITVLAAGAVGTAGAVTPIPGDGIGGLIISGIVSGGIGKVAATIRRNARHKQEALYLAAEAEGYGWAEQRNKRSRACNYSLDAVTDALADALPAPEQFGATLGRCAGAPGYQVIEGNARDPTP